LKLDLTDAELDELDELLADTPPPLQPLDVAMLDGYLCGVIVQPQSIAADQWLPFVFDLAGGPLPEQTDGRWRARVQSLLVRRHEALGRALEDEGAFSPVLPGDASHMDDAALRDAMREMPEASRVLLPWALGFQTACARFPALVSMADPSVDGALARVFRHLPQPTPQARDAFAELDKTLPLTSEEEAIDDLVLAVAELWELTQERRLQVKTVRRAAPKVGRNEPCPCGSGRKYKHCHGA
jgi:uncharacterized protein